MGQGKKENVSFMQPETYYTVHTDFFSFGLLLSLLALIQYFDFLFLTPTNFILYIFLQL